jgi:hypothetical protein
MAYINGLIVSNLKSLSEMLKHSLAAQVVTVDEIRTALEAEASPIPAGGDIYSVTATSTRLLAKIATSPDSDMGTIVKKILRSTKYAAITYFTVSGADNNPHHLPVQRLEHSTNSVNSMQPIHSTNSASRTIS